MALHEDDELDWVDAGELKPLGTEEEFAGMVHEMVVDDAPRVFALVEELGERAEGQIVVWGFEFGDRTQLLSTNGRPCGSCSSADRALAMLARTGRKVRLVWCEPAAAAA